MDHPLDNATPMLLRNRRGTSAAAFIEYLCCASALRSAESRFQRAKPEFIQHCQRLYAEQRGLCAVSGVRMIYGWHVKHPRQISIDRIDHCKGYEVGNVRLVTWFVNNARSNMSDDVLLFFAREIVKNEDLKGGKPLQ